MHDADALEQRLARYHRKCLETQAGIPSDRADRDRLRDQAAAYIVAHGLTPPQTRKQLEEHAATVLAQADDDAAYGNWLMVVMHNILWRDRIAAVPFEKRLLLLPKCLRDDKNCAGEFDEVGLLCGGCGRCAIDTLREEAMRLGYVVLVSEGTPVVVSLIMSGQVEAYVGLSCLATLEKMFPLVSSTGIPALALPLLIDGCRNTAADVDWLWEYMHIESV